MKGRGYRKRTDKEELVLRVLMLNSEHLMEIAKKAEQELGERYRSVAPLDFSRNPAVRYTTALSTAQTIPAGLTGADDEMLQQIGDSSAQVLRDRYATVGLQVMPTALRKVSADAERYLVFCHYAGVRIGYSERSKRPYLQVITPDMLELEYELDDPLEPSVYRHQVERNINGTLQTVTDVYDLRDLENPSYKVLSGTKNLTEAAFKGFKGFNGDFDGANYPEEWYSNGAPFAPIAVYGRPDNLARGLEIVELTLRVSVGWSWWWGGLRDACFKGRNARGMVPAGMSSTMAGAEMAGLLGIATGPEDVQVWVDTDKEVKGEHWQWDAPFDAKAHGEAIASYEDRGLSQMGMPVDLTKTGGEPIAYEVEARKLAAMKHYDDQRAGDAEVLRKVAAILNRVTGTSYPEDDVYGISYYEEVQEQLLTDPEEGEE